MMAREDADLIDAIERFEELLLEFMTPLWPYIYTAFGMSMITSPILLMALVGLHLAGVPVFFGK